ncbi:MAG: hydrogenase nickel incorporation protein HypB [Candidatus Binataceae bacterium]
MCSTCGCSDGAEARFDDPAGEGLAPREKHNDSSAHSHTHHHTHGPGDFHDDSIHSHGAHEHGHEHSHDPAHSHSHSHKRADSLGGAGGEDRMARTLRLEQDILAKNKLLAERNRGWFEGRQIAALNLMSSPGAGKTTLLERTIRHLADDRPVFVIEGDQETARDADRIRAAGCRVVQVNTGSGCHLDAAMVAMAARKLDPAAGSLVMIENVGNLVCPALFDLGESARVVVTSVTEGEDKPLKYPNMFRASDLMLLNKIDLLPHVQFDAAACARYARQINPRIQILELSATRGDGLEDWYAWLREQGREHLGRGF